MIINNHKNVAIRSKWKENNLFYGKLKKEENGKELLEEAFILPSKQEYPHHVIRGNTLVLSVDGVKKVYNQLKEKGLYHGKAKQHIDRHLKELGIKMNSSRKMEENFQFIEKSIQKFQLLEIDNSKESAVRGKWKNPGASFYNRLLNAGWVPEGNNPDMNECILAHQYLKEAYLIAPIKKIKYGPYGTTPFSRSGCKYPHHTIKGNKLVVHIDGLQAAYSRARQMGEFKGEVKAHLEKHYKELGLYEDSMMVESTNMVFESEEESSENTHKKEESYPKKIDRQESDKNGVKRKNLYIAFIEYCKKLNPKNTFSSLFDKDVFKEQYAFIPYEMRYFYRLANPMSCVLPAIQFESVSFFEDSGILQALDQIKKNNQSEDNDDTNSDEIHDDIDETIEDDFVENEMMMFFSINDLPKINAKNDTNEYVIFAGSPKEYYVFRNKDKKIYKSNDDKITEPIADSFDLFIQKIVGKEYL